MSGGREARERRAPKQPLLYDLGIGSLDAAIAQLHKAMGWRLSLVPFFFRSGMDFSSCGALNI